MTSVAVPGQVLFLERFIDASKEHMTFEYPVVERDPLSMPFADGCQYVLC